MEAWTMATFFYYIAAGVLVLTGAGAVADLLELFIW